MNPSASRSELDSLINDLLTGVITPERHSRLEELLTSDAQARSVYYAHIDLHLALQRANAIKADPDPMADSLKRDRSTTISSTRSSRTFRRGSLWPVSLITAAAIIGGIAVPQLLERRPDPVPAITDLNLATPLEATTETLSPQNVVPTEKEVPAVRLVNFSKAELLRDLIPDLGAPLQLNHEYTLAKGMLELEFANGATAILEGPAVFKVTSAERMELTNGNCSIYAPETAKGFEVLTPRSKVIDLGTRFSVNVNDEGNSDVQVLEGAAEIHPFGDQKAPALLQSGEANRYAAEVGALRPIKFDPQQYLHKLPDRVISYEAETVPETDTVRDLISVTVQRGGVPKTYSVNEMIGVDVIHFRSHSNSSNILSDTALPADPLEFLTKDRALTTGLINFNNPNNTLSTAPYKFEEFQSRHGLAIQFQTPVVNSPGPDIVLFEVQSVVYPLEGDHFRVSPLHSGKGLRSHTVTCFDVTLNSESAKKVAPFRVYRFATPVRNPGDFGAMRAEKGGSMALPFYALAVGIDLSDLGYPLGAKVEGIFIEDANNNKDVVIDPVFVAGLPESPIEPPSTPKSSR